MPSENEENIRSKNKIESSWPRTRPTKEEREDNANQIKDIPVKVEEGENLLPTGIENIKSEPQG